MEHRNIFLFPWVKQITTQHFSSNSLQFPTSYLRFFLVGKYLMSSFFSPEVFYFKKQRLIRTLEFYHPNLVLGISKIMLSFIENNISFLFLLLFFHNVGIIDLSYLYNQNLRYTLNYQTMNGQLKTLFYLFHSLFPIPPCNILQHLFVSTSLY